MQKQKLVTHIKLQFFFFFFFFIYFNFIKNSNFTNSNKTKKQKRVKFVLILEKLNNATVKHSPETAPKIDVVVLYFNNNTTRNSTNHCRIVSILRVSIHRECIGCVYQALIKLILIYPLENYIFVSLLFKLTPEIKC